MSDTIDFEGLSKLIAACRKAKVSKLKCGAVEVDFADDTMDLKAWPKHRNVERHGDGENQVEFQTEPDDSQLLLEDPLAYEKMQLDS